MTSTPRLAAVAGIVALLSRAVPALAADEQAFGAHTTAQLVNLCSTPQTDPTYAQSLQFCHGFAVGGLSYFRATQRPGAARSYCGLPANRQEAVDRFVEWVRANPRYAGDNPANTVQEATWLLRRQAPPAAIRKKHDVSCRAHLISCLIRSGASRTGARPPRTTHGVRACFSTTGPASVACWPSGRWPTWRSC